MGIKDNLLAVRARIDRACAVSGRDPGEVTLLAVSKTKSVEMIEEAIDAGQDCFGENYVQELTAKYEVLGDRVKWHMIGHLQTNKVRYIVDKVSLIHSVDSLHLCEEIEKQAARRDLAVPILLEVNVAQEDTKWGFSSEEIVSAAEKIAAMPHLRLFGLMTSAPYTEDPESNRIHFRNLRLLAEDLAGRGLLAAEKPVLSMGMTGDFEVAVQEGATVVRVGTAIFGER